ncbi:MAG: hypothetical protein O7G85_02805 [Planctomycetota bacterium]|nr:hypothetical protein [Planctomycetota bacterium]
MNLAIVLLLVMAPFGAPETPSAPPQQLFEHSQVAPEDTLFYLHISDVETLRGQLENLPIADWAGQFLQAGQVIHAWGNIANLAGVDAQRLMDMFIGDSLTFMIQGAGSDLEWVLMTPMTDERAGDLFRKLKVKIYSSKKKGLTSCILPEHRLMLIHSNQGMLFICPQKKMGLFTDVHRRIESPEKYQTLHDESVGEAIAKLAPGQAGVYIRHEEPLGGWSVASLDFQGTQLRIQHRARFGRDAFSRPITQKTIDPSVIQNFKDHALVATIEPTDTGDGMVELFLQQMLGNLSLIGEDIRKNLGDKRVMVLGDVEGRLQDQEVDMLLPTGAICLEVKNAEIAEKQLDEHLIKLSKKLNKMGRDLDGFCVEVPNRRQFIPGESRTVDLDSFTDWVGNGFPLLTNVDLCWVTVESEYGTYLVVATHEAALKESEKALCRAPVATIAKGKWASCGVANGLRLGQNIDSLIDHAELLALDGKSEELKSTLKLIASFAYGIENLTWKLKRPGKNEMVLEVDIELAPPISAQDE